MEIIISGASDDLIHVDGCEGGDEFCNPHIGTAPVALAGNFIAPDGAGVRLHAIYDGCWAFSLGQVDEDMEWPGWSVSHAQSPTTMYSMQVTLDAPEGTRFVLDEKYVD